MSYIGSNIATELFAVAMSDSLKELGVDVPKQLFDVSQLPSMERVIEITCGKIVAAEFLSAVNASTTLSPADWLELVEPEHYPNNMGL